MKLSRTGLVLFCLIALATGCSKKEDKPADGGGGGSSNPPPKVETTATGDAKVEVKTDSAPSDPSGKATGVATITVTDPSTGEKTTITETPKVTLFPIDPSQNPLLNGNRPLIVPPDSKSSNNGVSAQPDITVQPKQEPEARVEITTARPSAEVVAPEEDKDGFDYVLAKDIQAKNTTIALKEIKTVKSVNAQDSRGQTLLFIAAQIGDDKVVGALLAKNADVNVSDRDGTSPLLVALENKHVKVARLLLKVREIDVNAGRHDWTPLHEAAAHCDLETAQALFKRKANPKIVSFYGWTALDIAIYAERDPRDIISGQKNRKSSKRRR